MIIEEVRSITKKPAATNYPILDTIKNRWSPRAFSAEQISHDEFFTLMEAARWAPSSNNLQPWRFLFAKKGSKTWHMMYDCLSDFNQSWVQTAPILIYTIIKEKIPKGLDNFHALHDLGLAVGNLTIQAQSMGIAVHQMAGVDWKKAQQLLSIPEGYHIATAIVIGKYGGNLHDLSEELQETELAPRTRKELMSIVSEGIWNDNLL